MRRLQPGVTSWGEKGRDLEKGAGKGEEMDPLQASSKECSPASTWLLAMQRVRPSSDFWPLEDSAFARE